MGARIGFNRSRVWTYRGGRAHHRDVGRLDLRVERRALGLACEHHETDDSDQLAHDEGADNGERERPAPRRQVHSGVGQGEEKHAKVDRRLERVLKRVQRRQLLGALEWWLRGHERHDEHERERRVERRLREADPRGYASEEKVPEPVLQPEHPAEAI